LVSYEMGNHYKKDMVKFRRWLISVILQLVFLVNCMV
jgi:hypothetical protein